METAVIFSDMYSGYVCGYEILGPGELFHADGLLDAARRFQRTYNKEHADFEYGNYQSTDGYAVHLSPSIAFAESLEHNDYHRVADTLGDPDEYIVKR